MTRSASCGNCRFFAPEQDGFSTSGICLRWPPTPVVLVSQARSSVTSVWAETKASEWCGEWKGTGPLGKLAGL